MSETINQTPNELLIQIANDNESYPFPLEAVEEHFTAMVLNKMLFNEVWYAALQKLKHKYSDIIGNTFIVVSSKYFNEDTDFNTIDELEYYQKINSLYDNLKSVRVSIIQKDSPDGELIKSLQIN